MEKNWRKIRLMLLFLKKIMYRISRNNDDIKEIFGENIIL